MTEVQKLMLKKKEEGWRMQEYFVWTRTIAQITDYTLDYITKGIINY